jgi:hypothetical protein
MKKKRTARIDIRVSAQLKKAVQKYAEEHNTSVSAIILAMLVDLVNGRVPGNK